MEEKYFDELKMLYTRLKKNYKERVDKQRKLTCKQVKTKGRKFGVLPYQEERVGNKQKGKEVEEIEMKDGYFVYYFDEKNRIRFVEGASTFLKKICDFEIYDYIEDKIYTYRGGLSGVDSITISIFDDDNIKESYIIYDICRFAYEEYIYNDEMLLDRINVCVMEEKKEPRKWKQRFYFDENNNLRLIQRVMESYRMNCYSEVKLNYKNLDQYIENRVVDCCQQCFVNDKKIYAIDISLNIGEENPDIDLLVDTDTERKIIQDEFVCKYNIPLREFPLDDEEKDKVLNSVLKTIVRLWDNGILAESISLKIRKDGVNILDESNILPRWIIKNQQIVFSEQMIQYKQMEHSENVESKSIKEIIGNLENETTKKMQLEELVVLFQKMSNVIVKDVSDTNAADIFLMQAETVMYAGKLMFSFSLVRQIPLEDEFLKLGMEVIYELNTKNKLVSDSYWSDEVDGDFFAFVKNTEIYESMSKEKVYDVRVFWEET